MRISQNFERKDFTCKCGCGFEAVVAPPIQARMMRLIGENTKVGETEKYFRSDENYKENLMK